jgi:hypothetical protein
VWEGEKSVGKSEEVIHKLSTGKKRESITRVLRREKAGKKEEEDSRIRNLSCREEKKSKSGRRKEEGSRVRMNPH